MLHVAAINSRNNPTPAAGIAYVTTATDQSTSAASSYTFSTVSIGAAASDRFCIAIFQYEQELTRTVSSVTIGGVTATVNVGQGTSFGSGYSANTIACAAVPTGTTADFVITFSNTVDKCYLRALVFTGLSSATAYATYTENFSSSGTSNSLNLNTPANGLVVACQQLRSRTGEDITWTGVTEVYDIDFASADTLSGGYDLLTSAETPRTVTASWTNSNSNRGCAASFSPA